MVINPIQAQGQALIQNKTTNTSSTGSFSKMLSNAIGQLNQSQLSSQQAIQGYLNGNTTDLHNVMIAVEKSSIELQTAVQVRDKAINAYQEIMRMQV